MDRKAIDFLTMYTMRRHLNVYTATISGTWRMRSVGSEFAREYTIQSEQEERLGGSVPCELGVTDILVLQLGNASL
jgi:hypothetical protein